MASPVRRGARDLIAELLTEGSRFGFFQAVRLLALGKTRQTRPPVPEGLRFSSKLSLAFPASQIDRVTLRTSPEEQPQESAQAGDDALEMAVNFMGLTGPSGVLPAAYTELLIDRRNHFRDGAGHAFLDIFTHRAVSLFYAAWRKYRFYLPYESGHRDGFSRNILDIVGVGLRHTQRRLRPDEGGVPDLFLIHYAGLLSRRPVPAVNIEALVRGFFGVDARLEQFSGQWMALPGQEQSVLVTGRDCVLGRNAFVGERIWDRQSKMRLHLGPLDADQFARFMPGRGELVALRELVQFCTGLTLDCEVALVLKRDDIPAPVLQPPKESPHRLGYSFWLNSRTPTDDANDVRFMLFKQTECDPDASAS